MGISFHMSIAPGKNPWRASGSTLSNRILQSGAFNKPPRKLWIHLRIPEKQNNSLISLRHEAQPRFLSGKTESGYEAPRGTR